MDTMTIRTSIALLAAAAFAAGGPSTQAVADAPAQPAAHAPIAPNVPIAPAASQPIGAGLYEPLPADAIHCGPGPGGDVFAVVRLDGEPHPELCAIAQNVANAWAGASGSPVTVYVDGKDWTCNERPTGPNTYTECVSGAMRVQMRS
ncbi:hypothetical protein ACBJ59_24495 [Nonomuraea sp. MTCD27]|uniref:hypothetical protein n=1 Tax=Nonomuraea sp. MTCD27 TaxID=1676747 RepID=UPI0035C0433D